MNAKAIVKSALQQTGVFPLARLIYRRTNKHIRVHRKRDIEFYKNLLSPNSLVFDVGANLGQKTDVFLAAGCRSIALEPNRFCQSSLRLQFSRNSKVVIDERAVGPKAGFIDLYADGSEATASVLPSWYKRTYGLDRDIEPQRVPVVTLDMLITQYGKPNYIKVDVEGFEADVLKGLTQPVPLISIEFLHDNEDAMVEAVTVAQRLGKLSFRVADMEGSWISDRSDSHHECLRLIRSAKASGDLFMWVT